MRPQEDKAIGPPALATSLNSLGASFAVGLVTSVTGVRFCPYTKMSAEEELLGTNPEILNVFLAVLAFIILIPL